MHGLFYNNRKSHDYTRDHLDCRLSVGIRCSDTGYLGRTGLNLGLNSLAIRDIGTSYGAQLLI